MHTKFERLLSKSLTTLEVMAYYLVVHTGPGVVYLVNVLALCQCISRTDLFRQLHVLPH